MWLFFNLIFYFTSPPSPYPHTSLSTFSFHSHTTINIRESGRGRPLSYIPATPEGQAGHPTNLPNSGLPGTCSPHQRQLRQRFAWMVVSVPPCNHPLPETTIRAGFHAFCEWVECVGKLGFEVWYFFHAGQRGERRWMGSVDAGLPQRPGGRAGQAGRMARPTPRCGRTINVARQ